MVCEDLLTSRRQLEQLVSDANFCSIEGCETCSNKNGFEVCSKCASNLKLTSEGCKCDDVEFFDGSKCIPCHKQFNGCAVCDQDKCVECFNNYLLQSTGSCLHETQVKECSDPLCDKFENGKCVKCKLGRVCNLECSIYSYEGCVDQCSKNQVLSTNELGQPFCKSCGKDCSDCKEINNRVTCVACDQGKSP